MTGNWPDLVVRVLVLSGFGILLLAGILMAINAYLVEKSGKSTTHFETAAKILFGLWFLNNIALGVFGILAEWFTLRKWEIWTAYGISFLVGISIWLIARKEAPKEDRNQLVIVLLFFALLITWGVFVAALITGHY